MDWIDQQGAVYDERDEYTAPDGTSYPGTFPKGQIDGLQPIALVNAPTVSSGQQASLVGAEPDGQGGWQQKWQVFNLPINADIVWELIKRERDRRKAGGFNLAGEWFHSDEASRGQYGILLTTALEKSYPPAAVLDPAWKNMAGTFAPMTVKKLRDIRDVGLVLERTLFTVAENHKKAVYASATPWTYDYLSGWPKTYEDSL